MNVGRLAPSPTGLLHLGNAWAFWLAWLDIRAAGGRLVLRLEDLDPLRSKAEYAEGIRRDLLWLGLDWDEEQPPQSRRGPAYEAVLDFLAERGLTYPCFCTRKELRTLAGAPQVGDAGAPYPGFCRRLTPEERSRRLSASQPSALRLICPEAWRRPFTDRVMGRQDQTLADCGGDFALRRSDGVYAYQLAVVIDDLAAGVTSVVRGADLAASAPRQLYLYSLLGGRPPTYAHLPLLSDAQGQRLAKRHAALSLSALREAGARPENVLGFLAGHMGLQDGHRPLKAGEALPHFTWRRLKTAPPLLPEDPAAVICGRSGC